MSVGITFNLSISQAEVVSRALDLYARLGIGQIGEIRRLAETGCILASDGSPASLAALALIDDLSIQMAGALGYSPNTKNSIASPNVSQAAKSAYELKCVFQTEMKNANY